MGEGRALCLHPNHHSNLSTVPQDLFSWPIAPTASAPTHAMRCSRMVKLHVQRATLLQECRELVKERNDIAQELASGSGSGAAGQVEVAKRRLAAITLQIQRVQEEVTIVSEAAMKEGLTKCVRRAASCMLAFLTRVQRRFVFSVTQIVSAMLDSGFVPFLLLLLS